MTAQLVWDAFKGLLISLRPPTIFPAAVFVLAHIYGIAPCLVSNFEPDSTKLVILWIGLIVLFSYMLHGMGFRLIELFQGSKWFYPTTAFGKKMKSVTSDLYAQYGIDWYALYPCFKPILQRENYLSFINQGEDVLQLFINMASISIILGLESFYMFVFLGNIAVGFVLLLVGAVFAVFFYSCMLIAAERWGESVKAACALYRHDLAQSLYLKPARDFEEEKNTWRKTANFFLYYNPKKPDHFPLDGFIPQDEVLKMKQTVKSLDNNGKVKEN